MPEALPSQDLSGETEASPWSASSVKQGEPVLSSEPPEHLAAGSNACRPQPAAPLLPFYEDMSTYWSSYASQLVTPLSDTIINEEVECSSSPPMRRNSVSRFLEACLDDSNLGSSNGESTPMQRVPSWVISLQLAAASPTRTGTGLSLFQVHEQTLAKEAEAANNVKMLARVKSMGDLRVMHASADAPCRDACIEDDACGTPCSIMAPGATRAPTSPRSVSLPKIRPVVGRRSRSLSIDFTNDRTLLASSGPTSSLDHDA